MSEQRFFDEIDAEKVAISYRVLAAMIWHGLDEHDIRDGASLMGIDQKEVDKLWKTVMGVAA